MGGGEVAELFSEYGFWGGGGGALFLPGKTGERGGSMPPGPVAVSFLGNALPLEENPLILFPTSYFLFNALAFFQPAATWSPWRSWKLCAVEAVALASEREIEDGLLRNELAVFRAACFWANEVPWDGGSGFCGLVEILENLDWSSLNWDVWTFERLGVTPPGLEPPSSRPGFASWGSPPMPSPGTVTPADPSLFKASWLI